MNTVVKKAALKLDKDFPGWAGKVHERRQELRVDSAPCVLDMVYPGGWNAAQTEGYTAGMGSAFNTGTSEWLAEVAARVGR